MTVKQSFGSTKDDLTNAGSLHQHSSSPCSARRLTNIPSKLPHAYPSSHSLLSPLSSNPDASRSPLPPLPLLSSSLNPRPAPRRYPTLLSPLSLSSTRERHWSPRLLPLRARVYRGSSEADRGARLGPAFEVGEVGGEGEVGRGEGGKEEGGRLGAG